MKVTLHIHKSCPKCGAKHDEKATAKELLKALTDAVERLGQAPERKREIGFRTVAGEWKEET